MPHRRHHAVPESEDGFDQPDRTGRGLGMTHDALGRSDRAPVAVGAVHLRQAAELERVTDRRTGAVCLHHAHGGRVNAGNRQRRPVRARLRVQ